MTNMQSLSIRSGPTARLEPKPMPENITAIQPGYGRVMRWELAWGRLRRRWLRIFRPNYVARMRTLRQGDCLNCPHDVIDPRDLKFFHNVCGYYFSPEHDRFRWRGWLRLARVGLAELICFAALFSGLAAVIVAAAWLRDLAFWGFLAAIPLGLALFVVSFFRDPVRTIPSGPNTIVAPADGTVDTIDELESCDFLDGPAVKIGIFLSVFNVHVNRAPESSRVIELKYCPGLFVNAMNKDSAMANEQMWIALEGESPPHRRMLVKQIVGLIARRIVCELRPGQSLSRGQKIGMIKFGSRTELYLPKEEGLRIDTRLNQSVRGGTTILAQYVEPGTAS